MSDFIAAPLAVPRARDEAGPTSMHGDGTLAARRTLSSAGWRRLAMLAALLIALEVPVVLWGPAAYGATVTSAAFTGGSGTVSVGGVLYARSGGALTLTVVTSADTRCVEITGAHAARLTSTTAKSTWTFSFTGATGNGVQGITAAASPNFNANNCTGQSQNPGTASYILDNQGPAVAGALSPAPNAAGWNNSNVGISWSASDAGSGVGSGPTPATDSQTSNTLGATKTSTAADRLANAGSGSVTVKLDKSAPGITAVRVPPPNGAGWNNQDVIVAFTCDDSASAGHGGSGIKSCLVNGSSPPAATKVLSTSAAGQSVTGTAVDVADNTASTTVSGINIDKVAPSLSGAPVTVPSGTDPQGAKWYDGDASIAWTCSDALSGIAGSCPANSTVGGEGRGLKASATVADKAGNQTSIDSQAVNIDRTAPATTATAPAAWNNTDVTVVLSAADALSGVKATRYSVDGAPAQLYGGGIPIANEGDHTLEYWSEDHAGNVEAHKSVHVMIDKTSPTITHTQSPLANANGWNRSDVTVHFICDDALSGIASCTSDKVVAAEGKAQPVTGTAADRAGNTATDPATVSIDKTRPTIAAGRDRAANANGWYDDDVTVSFSCDDPSPAAGVEPSGIDGCPAPKHLGEGSGQTAGGTATDAAGNTASASEGPISIDKTAPALTGSASPAANAAGWHSDDVSVHWECSDAGSGVDGPCPPDETITGEGRDLKAAASIRDRAGNATTADSPAVDIDRTAPTTTASVPPALESGWFAGAVQVTLNAADNLSGVDTTYYSVDGGAAQTYGGPFSHAAKGTHTITFWSADKAGNAEDRGGDANSIVIRIDGVPPTITPARVPPANADGWNNTPVDVTFDCADAESGIAICAGNSRLEDETPGTSVTGNATDNAGNTAESTVGPIRIDRTAPDLTSLLPDPVGIDAAGARWYTGDVVAKWLCADGLSGIALDAAGASTCPAPATVKGEGRGLGAGPVSLSDKAGNSRSASVGDVNIDRKGPDIASTVSPSPNAAGWYSGAVKIDFTCADPKLADGSDGSGTAACPSTLELSREGANLSATSAAATDYAGNSTPGRTVGEINIDNTPPLSTDTVQCTLVNGYCNGSSPVTVSIAATDQAGLSGVKEIRYSIDGGTTWRTAAGASVTVPLTLNASGQATVRYLAVDNADNAEPMHADSVNYDGTAPKVTHTLRPTANAADWSNADTLVHFDAVDDPGGSGVDPATVTPDTTYTAETASQAIAGAADDRAGNHGTDAFTFKLDKTPPAIAATRTPATGNAAGWNNTPVTVSFGCSDPSAANGAAGSGVPSGLCPDPVTLSANNTAASPQSVTRGVSDLADNRASASVGGINIDMESPTVTINGVKDDAIYVLGAVPAATCTASDDFSGLASACRTTVTGGLPNGVGTYTYSATATDRAGNTTTRTATYRVIYNIPASTPFFLQPINDTAHTASSQLSIFKAGSTVPVKFQLKRSNGTVVQANSAPTWLTPVRGNLMTAAVDESAFSATGDTGTTFRWSDQQYIYNWGTSSTQALYYWRIGVRLDDGQSYTTYIGLRK
jgi:hypothetical protein